MKTAPKTRPSNVTSFILEGCWPLDGFDQRELRRLSKIAKRNGVGVADVRMNQSHAIDLDTFEFDETRSDLFKFAHATKRFPSVAMCVGNPDRSPAGINR